MIWCVKQNTHREKDQENKKLKEHNCTIMRCNVQRRVNMLNT